ncbi:cobalamin-binding protein [uncultured Marinobacter sp.]|uniref:cobalamin-binding protein n=1 Tax=uncultured Marinobacter sp. TaxID=187379 RepID=UPI0030DA63F1
MMQTIRFLTVALTVLGAWVALSAPVSAQDLCARDGRDQLVCLDRPAQRIVSLSPGATELLFSAGAGDRVIAVSAWSDYPPQAAELPQVGDSNRLDLETIMAMRPDLVVAWVDGNSRQQLDRLMELGIRVFWLAPREFADIAWAIADLALFAGTRDVGALRAARFRDGVEALQGRYADAEPVRVFYQVWNQPLMTVNRQELIGKAIELCGGQNVFADQSRLVPRVSREAVLDAAPEVILTAGRGDNDRSWLDEWRQFPGLPAIAADNLYLEPPDLLARPTERMLDGISHLCQTLEQARARL